MKKKSNVMCINLTDTNILYLQVLGFLDKRKRVIKTKNVSEFFNRCMDQFRGVNDLDQELELAEKLLKQDLYAKQKKRNVLDDEIQAVAQCIEDLRQKKGLP